MDVKSLGYTVKHYFTRTDSKCTHLLVQTPEGHLVVIEVEPFDHDAGILTSQLKASITPQSIVFEFVKKLEPIKTKICFLTHNGLDLHHLYGYSLLIKDTKADVPRLQLGEKFTLPLAYVKIDELGRPDDKPNLRHFVENSRHLTIFYDLLLRSNCQNLLDSSGPYMLFAPNNRMLERAYGPGARALKSKSKKLDIIICSYFVPGHHENNVTGKVSSIIGEELDLQNGIPIGVKEVEPFVDVTNGKIVIITSDNIFPIRGTNEFVLPTNLHIKLATTDVSDSTHILWKKQMQYASQVVSEARKYVEVTTEALNVIDSKMTNDLQFEDVKSFSRLIALQLNIESLTKNMKNL